MGRGLNRPWLATIAFICGIWLVADGYRTYRDGPFNKSADPYFDTTWSSIEEIRRVQQSDRIMRAVRERLQTPPAVVADVGISKKEATMALKTLSNRGMVERIDYENRDMIDIKSNTDDSSNSDIDRDTAASGKRPLNINGSQQRQILYRATEGAFSERNKIMQVFQWILERLFRLFR
jgi:hypothetical protein